MKILAIIPARYASTRFPGKPLLELKGKTMIERVYEQSIVAFDEVVVATDDNRIFEAVQNFGGRAVMTNAEHLNGTSRCLEALNIYSKQKGKEFDVVVNVQGDEPLINPDALKSIAKSFVDEKVQIATLVNKVGYNEELFNSNRIKVVIDKNQKAVYFSRSLIPFVRDLIVVNSIDFFIHIGVYAYRTSVLRELVCLEPSNSEISENLEQNRWIENGYFIKTIETDYESISIDTPEDVEKVLTKIQ